MDKGECQEECWPFLQFQEVEPRRKKEILNDTKICNVSVFFFYDVIPLFQNFLLVNMSHPFQDLTDSIICSCFPVFVNNSFKKPFLRQHQQNRRSVTLKLCIFLKKPSEETKDNCLYSMHLSISVSLFFPPSYVSFSRCHFIFTLPHQRAIRTFTQPKRSHLTLYI